MFLFLSKFRPVVGCVERTPGISKAVVHSLYERFIARAGATIAIARGDVACPAKALREWLDAGGIESGPIFRPIDKGGTVRTTRLTDRSVANIVKAYASRAGFDASVFSGHSLRAGFLTSAAGKGASIFKMMDVSRHKSVDTLRGYATQSCSRTTQAQACFEAGRVGGANRR